jgi:hypothetical protein
MLHSPLWWACLVLWLLNDHVLKGRGLLPSWLTGKLSDFAGLVVAPVLASALLGREGGRSRRALCFALVVAPFVALKVSESAAGVIERVSHTLGLSWRLWVDPTDLAALVVLPLAWRISARESRVASGGSLRPDGWSRAGALVGAVACLATSSSVRVYQTRVFLLNTSHRRPDIQIFRSTEPLDCSLDGTETVLAATFALERCALASPYKALPLDHDFRTGAELEIEGGERPNDPNWNDASAPKPPRPCDAVVLRTEGLPDTVVYWRDGTDKSEIDEDVELKNTAVAARAVFLESLGSTWVLTPGVDSASFEYEGSLPEGSCAAAR